MNKYTSLKIALQNLRESNYQQREALEKLKFTIHDLQMKLKLVNEGFRV